MSASLSLAVLVALLLSGCTPRHDTAATDPDAWYRAHGCHWYAVKSKHHRKPAYVCIERP